MEELDDESECRVVEEKKQKKERRAPRVETMIPTRWGVTEECSRHGKILNLSSTGCLIKTQAEPLNGRTIFIRFGLPTGHSIELRGEVVQFRRNVGFALEFLELSESDSYILNQLVEYYRQMSPDDPRQGLALLSDYREALKSLIQTENEANGGEERDT